MFSAKPFPAQRNVSTKKIFLARQSASTLMQHQNRLVITGTKLQVLQALQRHTLKCYRLERRLHCLLILETFSLQPVSRDHHSFAAAKPCLFQATLRLSLVAISISSPAQVFVLFMWSLIISGLVETKVSQQHYQVREHNVYMFESTSLQNVCSIRDTAIGEASFWQLEVFQVQQSTSLKIIHHLTPTQAFLIVHSPNFIDVQLHQKTQYHLHLNCRALPYVANVIRLYRFSQTEASAVSLKARSEASSNIIGSSFTFEEKNQQLSGGKCLHIFSQIRYDAHSSHIF